MLLGGGVFQGQVGAAILRRHDMFLLQPDSTVSQDGKLVGSTSLTVSRSNLKNGI